MLVAQQQLVASYGDENDNIEIDLNTPFGGRSDNGIGRRAKRLR